MITIHKHPDHNRTVVFKGLERSHPDDPSELKVQLKYLIASDDAVVTAAIALDDQVIPEIHKRFNEHAALVAVAEAAEQANKWIGSGERCPNLKCALTDAFANLAAVRGGGK